MEFDLFPKIRFDDSRVLITGASKGLGAYCALYLASLGAQLLLVSRSVDGLESIRNSCKNPDKHKVLAADLTDPVVSADKIASQVSLLGGIDIIIHAAGGGFGLKDPLIGYQDFQTLLSVNVAAAAEINSRLAPLMIKQGFGRIVHVGSIASSEAVGSVGYNTAKAALAAYVRSLGRELAVNGIVATGILPGGFIAPGNAMDRLKERNPNAYKDFINARLPRKKMGVVQEILPLVIFLCSDHALMMGGCLVPIDGAEGLSYHVN